jgi:dipeptidyl aminopeptidase/acylaminoacyl peptidase
VYDLATGDRTTLYAPQEQIGVPTATPSGARVAFIEACCSDRLVVAGEVTILDTNAGETRRLRVPDVDVTHVEWRDEDRLFCIGVARLNVVAVDYDVKRDEFIEVWNTDGSCGQRYPIAWAAKPDGMYAVADSYESYHRIISVRGGNATTLCDFTHEGVAFVRDRAGSRENVVWTARDGLQIDGILTRPPGDGPFPLVVNVHGGPVWSFRNSWSIYYYYTPILVANGYAVLSPNPRGSSGRGLDFQRLVRGDMCGEDTHDIIAGVEALIARGVIDAKRVAVTGGSYGGYMSSWLVTQTNIFAAAMPMAPVTDAYSQHFTSNIGTFDCIFLDANPYESDGRYFERSPVFHARNARTPSMIMCGALDRCTPLSQALEFHRALVENGVPSELIVYPQEGHHVNAVEARVDQITRMLTWLDRYCPAPIVAAR